MFFKKNKLKKIVCKTTENLVTCILEKNWSCVGLFKKVQIICNLWLGIYNVLCICWDVSPLSNIKVSSNIVRNFISKITNVFDYIQMDVEALRKNDPAVGNEDEITLAYPGVFAICVYRLAHELYVLNVPCLPRMMTEFAHSKTGIDIHPGAEIGKYFCIDHGTGIVIGETSTIGNNVTIYHGVTLGAFVVSKDCAKKKRHPTIGDNVTIYAGASVLGGETVIENNSIVGCCSIVAKSIEPFSKIKMGSVIYE